VLPFRWYTTFFRRFYNHRSGVCTSDHARFWADCDLTEKNPFGKTRVPSSLTRRKSLGYETLSFDLPPLCSSLRPGTVVGEFRLCSPHNTMSGEGLGLIDVAFASSFASPSSPLHSHHHLHHYLYCASVAFGAEDASAKSRFHSASRRHSRQYCLAPLACIRCPLFMQTDSTILCPPFLCLSSAWLRFAARGKSSTTMCSAIAQLCLFIPPS